MSRFLKHLYKIRSAGFAELRLRGAQRCSVYYDRIGLGARSHLPGDGRFSRLLDAGKLSQAAEGSFSAVALLDHFRNRDTAKFFQGFSDRAGTIAELRGRFHAGHDAVVKAADNIIEGKFDLLGFHGISFGQPPDWHLEPISTRRVPLAHWSRINYLDSQVAGDKKIIWELNRHQYFATLGRAYWRTGDERYAAEIVKHIVDWMDHNPPGQGINWASSLEVSFRSISWIWALYFFRHSPALTAIVFWRILKHLYVHGLHIETYLSTHYSPNTHLTGEALGLFYLGTLLPEFRCARRWRTLGHNILVQELGRQVRKDGVYFEQTSYYQRYTAEFYTHFYLLKQINSEPIEPELKDKLRGLLDHLMFLTRPDGTTPLIGDDDGGRLVTIDERRRNDFRAALVSGAIVLDNPQYKYVAGAASEESLWLCGSAGLSMYDKLLAERPKEDSRAFVDGGYYVMRDGWTRDDNFLVIDCGAHGSLSCGHAHADALSIDAAAGGRTLLVDPGTYTYTGSAELRDDFRHAGNHNTVTIDNESSSIPNGPFSWSQIARCTTHQWHDHQRFSYFKGSQDGYSRLLPSVEHLRSILFLKHDYWVIRDSIRTAGKHDYSLNFQFVPEIEPCFDGPSGIRARGKDGSEFALFTFGGQGKWLARDGWVSECYRERTAAPGVSFAGKTDGNQELVTFLTPDSPKDRIRWIRETEAIGGRAFELGRDDYLDLIMIGNGGLVQTEAVNSNFEWSWVRFDHRNSKITEMVLLLGSRIDCQTKIRLESPQTHAWVVLKHPSNDECEVSADSVDDFSVRITGAKKIRFNGNEIGLPQVADHDASSVDLQLPFATEMTR